MWTPYLQRLSLKRGILKKKKLYEPVWLLFVTIWLQPQRIQHGTYHWLRSVVMASSAGNSPEPEESSFSVPIIARLIFYVPSQGNKKKKTIKRDTKTKEFTHTFCLTKSNYLDFLTTILTKHHVGNKLQVTDRRRYICKMQVPPST